jgi:hypothetical protein
MVPATAKTADAAIVTGLTGGHKFAQFIESLAPAWLHAAQHLGAKSTSPTARVRTVSFVLSTAHDVHGNAVYEAVLLVGVPLSAARDSGTLRSILNQAHIDADS